LDEKRTKYNLPYFVRLAKELKQRGTHLLAIKDMAGLCKPYAAARLVKALWEGVGLPSHVHTHDCSGGQTARYLTAAEARVPGADCAMATLAGMTSQPSLNALVEAMRFHPRDTGLADAPLQEVADYWEAVRKLYAPFETGQIAPQADVYENEMPGGQ